ncbi:hypothetical protein ACCS96_36855, partial [Rhizobium ruizarguesonis]
TIKPEAFPIQPDCEGFCSTNDKMLTWTCRGSVLAAAHRVTAPAWSNGERPRKGIYKIFI